MVSTDRSLLDHTHGRRPRLGPWARHRAPRLDRRDRGHGRWLNAFYAEVERDPLVGPVFGGHVTLEHRGQVTAWWAEVMGGPSRYTEELGGYEQMLAKHGACRSRRSSGCVSAPR